MKKNIKKLYKSIQKSIHNALKEPQSRFAEFVIVFLVIVVLFSVFAFVDGWLQAFIQASSNSQKDKIEVYLEQDNNGSMYHFSAKLSKNSSSRNVFIKGYQIQFRSEIKNVTYKSGEDEDEDEVSNRNKGIIRGFYENKYTSLAKRSKSELFTIELEDEDDEISINEDNSKFYAIERRDSNDKECGEFEIIEIPVHVRGENADDDDSSQDEDEYEDDSDDHDSPDGRGGNNYDGDDSWDEEEDEEEDEDDDRSERDDEEEDEDEDEDEDDEPAYTCVERSNCKKGDEAPCVCGCEGDDCGFGTNDKNRYDWRCCHREWGPCEADGKQACITVFTGEGQPQRKKDQCQVAQVQLCNGQANEDRTPQEQEKNNACTKEQPYSTFPHTLPSGYCYQLENGNYKKCSDATNNECASGWCYGGYCLKKD